MNGRNAWCVACGLPLALGPSNDGVPKDELDLACALALLDEAFLRYMSAFIDSYSEGLP